jgi:NADPH:quinone reductase-like Zn-dependent oxidoreductase
MIGLGFSEHGGTDRLALVELPAPTPGPGEVRIRVRAAAFNRLDRFVLAGIPGVPIQRPHILGSDGAGIVDRVGDGVTDLSTGDRVVLNPGLSDGTCAWCLRGDESLCPQFQIIGEHTQGTATEFVVVPRRNVYPLPPRLNFAEGAAVPLVFQTAWRALVTVGGLQSGETVAIVGAGGGVATAAIQIAKLRGAKVAVTTRSAERGERALTLGADAVLVVSDAEPIDRALWKWSEKKGVDLIFDSVGAPSLPRSLRAVARGGRVVVVGATAGPIAEVDLRTLFWRQASIRGSTMASRREFEAVLQQLAEGRLRPVIDAVYPWAKAVEAFRRLEDPELFGKVVLETGSAPGSATS